MNPSLQQESSVTRFAGLIALLLIILGLGTACSDDEIPSGREAIFIRLENLSDFNFDRATLGFSDGHVEEYLQLAAATPSRFREVQVAHQIVELRVWAGQQMYESIPTSFDGFEALGPGNYTYQVVIDQMTGNVELTFQAQE